MGAESLGLHLGRQILLLIFYDVICRSRASSGVLTCTGLWTAGYSLTSELRSGKDAKHLRLCVAVLHKFKRSKGLSIIPYGQLQSERADTEHTEKITGICRVDRWYR